MSRSPILHIGEILAWADAHHARTGKWPNVNAGRVVEAPRLEKWMAIQVALCKGYRGLRPGNSLARLLEKHRGVRNTQNLPDLTHAQIVRWAKRHRERTGSWPTLKSGRIVGTNGETWNGIQAALSNGGRGFPPGSSLAQVLEKSLGVRNIRNLLPFTNAKILAWADLHHQKTGEWPNRKSGKVIGSRGDTWNAIDTALHEGARSLPGGNSLADLLAAFRGVKKKHRRGRQLAAATVLEWAKAHHRSTAAFPQCKSGPVHGKPGETWGALHVALVYGYRGLPKGTTLSKLLAPLKEKMARAGRR